MTVAPSELSNLPAAVSAPGAWELRFGHTVRYAAFAACLILLLVLIVLPLSLLLYGSVRDAAPGLPGSFTLENYGYLFSVEFGHLLLRSVIIGIGSTLLATCIGVVLAIALVRSNIPYAKTMDWLVVVPGYLSPFVGAVAWVMLLSPTIGYINALFRSIGLPPLDIYTYGGIIWVTGLYYAPVAYLFLRPVLSSIDTSMEEAALMMGASPRLALFRVVIPLAMPAVVSSILVIFVITIGDFAIPGVLGTRDRIEVIPTALLRLAAKFPSDPNTAAVLGVFLVSVTALGLGINQWYLSKRDYATVGGRGVNASSRSTARNYFAFSCVVLYLFVALFMPILAMIVTSFQQYPTTNIFSVSYTLENYIYIFTYPSVVRSIVNSIVLALGTGFFGSLLAIVLAYFIVRGKGGLPKMLDYVGSSTIAVPHTVLALGMIWLWVTIPFGVYGTRWILLFAYVAAYLPFALRSAISAFMQIDRSLEEAGSIFGASWLVLMKRIVIPMMIPAALSGATMLIYYSFRELSASLMLYTAGSEVMATAFWEIFAEGRYPQLFALSMLNIVIVFGLVGLANYLNSRIKTW